MLPFYVKHFILLMYKKRFPQLELFLSSNFKNVQKLLVLHPQQNPCFDDEDDKKYYIFIMLTIAVLNRDGCVIG